MMVSKGTRIQTGTKEVSYTMGGREGVHIARPSGSWDMHGMGLPVTVVRRAPVSSWESMCEGHRTCFLAGGYSERTGNILLLPVLWLSLDAWDKFCAGGWEGN